jgi:deoxyribonuclease V
MTGKSLHFWPRNYREAVAWQEAQRHRVKIQPLGLRPRLVAGVDAAFDREGRRIFGAAALYSYPELDFLEEAGVADLCPFPYIPGLLAFREAPVLAEALGRLPCRLDVVLVDGQGIAHPRGLGIASHLGVMLNIPTIGVAKSRLVGEGAEPGPEAGAAAPLYWEGKVVGLILRTRAKVKPLYLSVGHLITLEECRQITMGCVTRYRLPLPLRHADLLSRRLRRNATAAQPEALA